MEVMLQNLRKTKSLNINIQKCKKSQYEQSKMQKGTGSNKRTKTGALDPYDLFSRGMKRNMK